MIIATIIEEVTTSFIVVIIIIGRSKNISATATVVIGIKVIIIACSICRAWPFIGVKDIIIATSIIVKRVLAGSIVGIWIRKNVIATCSISIVIITVRIKYISASISIPSIASTPSIAKDIRTWTVIVSAWISIICPSIGISHEHIIRTTWITSKYVVTGWGGIAP